MQTEQSALILFAHGSRDARWAEPFDRLRKAVQAQLPAQPVRLAFLELMAPNLHDAVAELVRAGCVRISVVPVFLGQGGHVRRDLPRMVDDLCEVYPGIVLQVAEAVGENDLVLQAMVRYCVSCADDRQVP